MTTLFGPLPTRLVIYFPVIALASGYLQAKLLALFREVAGPGWAEALTVATGLALAGARPDWLTTPLRGLLLWAIERAEPAALAIPAMLGVLALVALAWTSRPAEPHALDEITSKAAAAVIVFCVLVTIGVLGPLGAIPLGGVATLCLITHGVWHERMSGATVGRLRRSAEHAECLGLAWSAWLF